MNGLNIKLKPMVTKICVSNYCCSLRRKSTKNNYTVYSKAPKLVHIGTTICPDCGSILSERKTVTKRKKRTDLERRDSGKVF